MCVCVQKPYVLTSLLSFMKSLRPPLCSTWIPGESDMDWTFSLSPLMGVDVANDSLPPSDRGREYSGSETGLPRGARAEDEAASQLHSDLE